MTKRIIITVSDGIDEILDITLKMLGKKKAVLVCDLMEHKLNDMGLISWYLDIKKKDIDE